MQQQCLRISKRAGKIELVKPIDRHEEEKFFKILFQSGTEKVCAIMRLLAHWFCSPQRPESTRLRDVIFANLRLISNESCG